MERGHVARGHLLRHSAGAVSAGARRIYGAVEPVVVIVVRSRCHHLPCRRRGRPPGETLGGRHFGGARRAGRHAIRGRQSAHAIGHLHLPEHATSVAAYGLGALADGAPLVGTAAGAVERHCGHGSARRCHDRHPSGFVRWSEDRRGRPQRLALCRCARVLPGGHGGGRLLHHLHLGIRRRQNHPTERRSAYVPRYDRLRGAVVAGGGRARLPQRLGAGVCAPRTAHPHHAVGVRGHSTVVRIHRTVNAESQRWFMPTCGGTCPRLADGAGLLLGDRRRIDACRLHSAFVSVHR
eukprot:ctg_1818.g303